MRQTDPSDERLPAIGHPPRDRDTPSGPNGDFSDEHDITAVSGDIITGEDKEKEGDDSPRGWAGLEPDYRPD